MSIGGGSSKDAQQTQYPYFQSQGGITPQQSDLAQYDYGQSLLQGQGQFEGGDQGGGISDSTMATQTAGGANIGKALNASQMSDTDQTAQYEAYQNAINIDQQNQSASLAQGQAENSGLSSSLGSLAALGSGTKTA